MYTNQVFPFQQPVFWIGPPVQAMPPWEFSWKPLLLTAGAFGLAALVVKAFENPAPVWRCGMCGKNGHDTRSCSQNPAKRVRFAGEENRTVHVLQPTITQHRGTSLRRTSRRRQGTRDVWIVPPLLRTRRRLQEHGHQPAILATLKSVRKISLSPRTRDPQERRTDDFPLE